MMHNEQLQSSGSSVAEMVRHMSTRQLKFATLIFDGLLFLVDL